MIFTGKRVIPVIIITFLSYLSATEILFYKLPSEQTSQQFQKIQQQFAPHNLVNLSTNWQLKNPENENTIKLINLPTVYSRPIAIIFQKDFTLHLQHPKERFYLHCNAIQGNYDILLNGKKIYAGQTTFAPLRLRLLPSWLQNGPNTLTIRFHEMSDFLAQEWGWFPLGIPKMHPGIPGLVFLERIREPAIETVQLQGKTSNGQWIIEGNLHLSHSSGDDENGKWSIQLQLLEGNRPVARKLVEVSSGSEQQIPVKWEDVPPLSPWGVNAPGLYKLRVTLDSAGVAKDVWQKPIAFREILIDDKAVILNGHPLPVRGINYVYQNPAGTELFDAGLIAKDLRWIKAQGFNAIRVIHHPLPEEFYTICDSLGLLCFQDVPVVLLGRGTSLEKQDLVRYQMLLNYLSALYLRHPSMAAIGISFFANTSSPDIKTGVEQISAFIDPLNIPRYVVTPFSYSKKLPANSFLLKELLRRDIPEITLRQLFQNEQNNLILPSAFIKPLSSGLDTSKVSSELQKIIELYKQVQNPEFRTHLQGHFIPTYSDYFLDFPSLQNGIVGNFYLNRIGLVSLDRKARFLPKANIASQKENIPPSEGEERKNPRPFLYVIIGLLNLFLAVVAYRQSLDFRNNLNYSIRRPHGFFMNLQERLIIPTGQSTFIIFIISINGGIILGALTYYFRNNLLFDYLLSLIFHNPSAKEWVCTVIWNQANFIFLITTTIIMFFYLVSLIIYLLFSFLVSRIQYRQVLAISAWSAAPFVFLIPLGPLTYNLLTTGKSLWIISGILLYFHVWVYFRWINGIRVITTQLYSRVFTVVTGGVLLIMVLIAYYFQQRIHIFEHLQLLYYLLKL